jgi:shikimate kinase
MTTHLLLTGMMGAGKSRWGRRLAEHHGVDFVDADEWLEHQSGLTIEQWFTEKGEEAFRTAETEALQAILTMPPAIIATGGGVVLRAQNRELLQTHYSWYLQYPVTELIQHLRDSKKTRPLLLHEQWESIVEERLHEREPFYCEATVKIMLGGLTDEGKWHRLLKEWDRFITATT